MFRPRIFLELMAVAFQRFVLHDGWAIASHIALSALTSLFPFMLFLTALAPIFGTAALADEAANIILDAWPKEVAAPIASEVHNVLTRGRGDVLTLGVVFALYFSSSGVESLRVGLNRAYGIRDVRPWWLTRLESILYVVFGAVTMLGFAFLVVLGPIVWRLLTGWVPALEPFRLEVTLLRFGFTTVLIVCALVIAHKFIAAGRRRFRDLLPGLTTTLVLWLVGGLLFGLYLDSFSRAYVTTYGGLATAMVALVFLYWLAAMFLYGGELNGTVIAARRLKLGDAPDPARLSSLLELP